MRLEVTRVAVRNLSRDRDVELPPGVLTRDAHDVVADPDVDLVVEVIGGIEPARELITTALAGGKPVVTANKELLANVGVELFQAADRARRRPAVRGRRRRRHPARARRCARACAASRSGGCIGIVNGTTNYILTKMTEQGAAYGEALAEAQRLGFAERDPTADVEGFDAGAKAAIIASIAFGARVVAGDVYHEGISHITRRRHRRRPPARLRRQAAGHRRARRRRAARSPCASTRRWCPCTTRWPACGRASTPCSSRATPSAS